MAHTYHVEYKMHSADQVRGIDVVANSKEDAWDKATFERIPEAEGDYAYSSWTASVTYANGNWRRFNTFEGKPF